MKEYKYGEEKPEFNQAALYVTTLDWITREIVEALKHGDLLAAYRLTERMFVLIDYKARIEKEKELFNKSYENYLVEIETKLNTIHNLLQSDNKKVLAMNSGKIDKDIREVSRMLYWLQWDLDLIFPKKQKRIDYTERIKRDFR